MKYIRIVAIICGALVLSIAAGVSYWGRKQTIDFALLLPESIVMCSKSIGSESREYVELRQWLSLNKDGWVNSIVTYANGVVATGEGININVLGDGVIVNYTKNGKTWSQVTKSKPRTELKLKCSS